MKSILLERILKTNEEDKIIMKHFEEDLNKKLDEIFKMESKKFITEMHKTLSEPFCKSFNNN